MVEMTEQQAMAKMQMNEQRLAQIQKQVNSLGRAADELKMTISTLTELPTNGEDGLLPLGGAFIPMKTVSGNINLNIGSGIVAEKTREEAIATLEKREQSMLATMKKLQQSGASLRNESQMIQKKLQERAQQSNVPVISG